METMMAIQPQSSMSFIHDFYNLMKVNNVIMIYEGIFNQDITKVVLTITERKFDSEGLDSIVKKKVFNVMVESLQNICKHQYPDHEGGENIPSIFMIGTVGNEITVISGNVLHNETIPSLRTRLDQINSLDKEGLKQLYKEVRIASTISEVGGAGLGFIDMARKSENRLSYHFTKINDELSFFSLLSRVSKKDHE